MGFFILIAGITIGLMIEAIAYFIFSYNNYIKNDYNEPTAIDWTMILYLY